jgi:hypothetical protein
METRRRREEGRRVADAFRATWWTTNWIRARKPRETEAGICFDDSIVEEAAKNIYAMAAKQSQGSFKPQRERHPNG